ncbi:MAG: aminotransferase class I/II-fold pyridoxal phosphate-dependent enzyme [Gammaproteobacteria bacterium]|nr:aminotransferase class I/II-fold pyridoxal phosphate-dependent enzyme [Gammaproteobacteria bacterium]
MPDTGAPPNGKSRTTLDFYHSPTQLRFDTWNRLKEHTHRLAEKKLRKTDVAALTKKTRDAMTVLQTIEDYTAFPSHEDFKLLWQLFEQEDFDLLSRVVSRVVRALTGGTYRSRQINLRIPTELEDKDEANQYYDEERQQQRPYFELLFVDESGPEDVKRLRESLHELRRPEDQFIYDIVVVPSFEDALIAVLFNYNIQSVVIRYGFPLRSVNHLEVLQRYLARIDESEYEEALGIERGPLLGNWLSELRPELDLYLVTDAAVEDIAGNVTQKFTRIFYQQEDYLDLHLNVLRGIQARYQTPFFTALRKYSRQPTGVFHAMPISRGKSITKSHWIKDMVQFYGMNIFLAETSATSGGLDSLLQPHGPIKKAQELAARAFGAKRTYFVTNGTSTANKIVVQALVKPGDIILVDRDCHKSHHYGMVLAGAYVCYLDSYPLNDYSMYGAVPLKEIKHKLLMYKKAGLLHKVKMLLLTNCTFDGVVYNVKRVMEECLAIKPDLIFLWDEAWFAFASFTPSYRRRTAMATARHLKARYRSTEYAEEYADYKKRIVKLKDADLVDEPLLPDPDKVRIRVYATQSTHKSLTSLRQGSMIHVYDQDFNHKVQEPFNEAFMTHTSTSPNYQILASLDIGRRQVELEGFEMVQKQIELAMAIRERVALHPLLNRYFRFLNAKDMIPEEYRPSGIDCYFDKEKGWRNTRMEEAWASDDFVIDLSRLTLYLGKTGVDGDTFKNEYLMDKYGIQINKTSRNTVLFMTNIGTTRSSVAFLLEVLVKIATELEQGREDASRVERKLIEKRVKSLSEELPPLPDFSYFHTAFRPGATKMIKSIDGDIRSAFFYAYDDENCEYMTIDEETIGPAMKSGRELVSASFVTPYPPGFPVLVPGQVISEQILAFIRALDVKEIHGYEPEIGLQLFTEEALQKLQSDS